MAPVGPFTAVACVAGCALSLLTGRQWTAGPPIPVTVEHGASGAAQLANSLEIQDKAEPSREWVDATVCDLAEGASEVHTPVEMVPRDFAEAEEAEVVGHTGDEEDEASVAEQEPSVDATQQPLKEAASRVGQGWQTSAAQDVRPAAFAALPLLLIGAACWLLRRRPTVHEPAASVPSSAAEEKEAPADGGEAEAAPPVEEVPVPEAKEAEIAQACVEELPGLQLEQAQEEDEEEEEEAESQEPVVAPQECTPEAGKEVAEEAVPEAAAPAPEPGPSSLEEPAPEAPAAALEQEKPTHEAPEEVPAEPAEPAEPPRFTPRGSATGGAAAAQRSSLVQSFVKSDAPTAEPPLALAGCGTGGLEEMRELLDDAQVQWGYLKFSVGEGTFRRQKLVFLHFNGASCASLARGRANQHTPWVHKSLCGAGSLGPKGASAKLELHSKDEATIETVLERVRSILVSDNLGQLSVQSMLQDYQKQVQEAAQRAGLEGEQQALEQSKALFSTGHEALRAVASADGLWNWALLRPDAAALPLAAGGAGSLEEMVRYLRQHEDEVFAGLLRLSFGEGQLRRCKHAAVCFVGARAQALARGKFASQKPKVEKAIAEFVNFSCVVQSTGVDELTLDAVIEKVRKASHIDDAVLGQEGRRQLWSAESFLSAQREERRRAARAAGAAAAAAHKARFEQLSAKEALELVRRDESLNWALFGLKPSGQRLSALGGA